MTLSVPLFDSEMPLNETDRGWIKNAISEALRDHSHGFWVRFRQWSPLGAVVAIGLFSINEWGKYVEFRTHTNDQFEKVLTQLGSLRALSSASQPTNKQNQDAAKQLLVDVRSHQVPAIPLKAVEEAGRAFVEAGSKDPGAWAVALDYLQYVSYLSRQPPLLQPRKDVKKLGIGSWPMEFPGLFLSIGLFGEADLKTGAISELIASPKDYSAVPITPPRYITFTLSNYEKGNDPTGAIRLDGFRLRGVIFKDLHIAYRGGPLEMDNVWFVNCTFSIDSQPTGVKLANQILAASETSSQVSFQSRNVGL